MRIRIKHIDLRRVGVFIDNRETPDLTIQVHDGEVVQVNGEPIPPNAEASSREKTPAPLGPEAVGAVR